MTWNLLVVGFGVPPFIQSRKHSIPFSSPYIFVSFFSSQLPLGKIGRGFSSKDPDFHDDYGSLQNEDCGDDDLQHRAEQSRLEGYNGLEVTNV